MQIKREVVQQALDSILMAQVTLVGNLYPGVRLAHVQESITALREALASPEQEPVAWVNKTDLEHLIAEDIGVMVWSKESKEENVPLYKDAL